MDVAKAARADLDRVMEIVAACVRQFRNAGTCQWNEDYPTRDTFAADLAAGALYVLQENNVILGAVVLNETQTPEYAELTWLQNETTPLVVHRLCVDPAHQRTGAARRLMDFAESHARQNNYASIRLDTHTGNPRAIALYERRGYRIQGYATLKPRNLPVVCFEMTMSIRDERPNDRQQVRTVNEAAFGHPDEADLIDKLRTEGAVLASFVAELNNQVVGHILFSRMTIETGQGSIAAVALAPMAVLPDHQGRYIGSQLIHHGLTELRTKGEHIVIVLGHTHYYPRFGFSPEKAGNLTSPFPPEAYMALELSERALEGISGHVRYAAAFGL